MINQLDTIEDSIIQSLFYNAEYFSRVYPSLKEIHFSEKPNQDIFREIQKYVKDHEVSPSLKDIALKIKNSSSYSNDDKKKLITKISNIQKSDKHENLDFILKETQDYIKKTQLTSAIMESVDIIKEGKEFDPIIDKFTSALNVSFDTDPGLDYNESLVERQEYYHKSITGISTGVKSIDKTLNGGFMDKTLNVFLSVSGGGKSAMLVSVGANMLLKGKNILYITLEMSEKEIAKRFDANILAIDSRELRNTNKEEIEGKFNQVKDKLGKLYIKEYPAGGFNTLQLKSLVEDIHNTKGVEFDIIIVDYLGLMSSYRTSLSKVGSYGLYKSVAEELHGLSKTCIARDRIGIPILTAGQINRGGYNNLEVGMDSISESLGIAMTADNIIGILQTDALRERKEVVLKFMKNRNSGILRDIVLKVDFSQMRFYDFEEDRTNTEDVLGDTRERVVVEEDFGSFKF